MPLHAMGLGRSNRNPTIDISTSEITQFILSEDLLLSTIFAREGKTPLQISIIVRSFVTIQSPGYEGKGRRKFDDPLPAMEFDNLHWASKIHLRQEGTILGGGGRGGPGSRVQAWTLFQFPYTNSNYTFSECPGGGGGAGTPVGAGGKGMAPFVQDQGHPSDAFQTPGSGYPVPIAFPGTDDGNPGTATIGGLATITSATTGNNISIQDYVARYSDAANKWLDDGQRRGGSFNWNFEWYCWQEDVFSFGTGGADTFDMPQRWGIPLNSQTRRELSKPNMGIPDSSRGVHFSEPDDDVHSPTLTVSVPTGLYTDSVARFQIPNTSLVNAHYEARTCQAAFRASLDVLGAVQDDLAHYPNNSGRFIRPGAGGTAIHCDTDIIIDNQGTIHAGGGGGCGGLYDDPNSSQTEAEGGSGAGGDLGLIGEFPFSDAIGAATQQAYNDALLKFDTERWAWQGVQTLVEPGRGGWSVHVDDFSTITWVAGSGDPDTKGPVKLGTFPPEVMPHVLDEPESTGLFVNKAEFLRIFPNIPIAAVLEDSTDDVGIPLNSIRITLTQTEFPNVSGATLRFPFNPADQDEWLVLLDYISQDGPAASLWLQMSFYDTDDIFFSPLTTKIIAQIAAPVAGFQLYNLHDITVPAETTFAGLRLIWSGSINSDYVVAQYRAFLPSAVL